jgi:hypothetical protein
MLMQEDDFIAIPKWKIIVGALLLLLEIASPSLALKIRKKIK